MLRRNIILLLAVAMLSALAAPALAKTLTDELGRTIWPKDTLDLTVKASDELSGVKTVELWYRKDGGEWLRWPEEAEAAGTKGSFRFDFKAPDDGVYDFFSVSVDSVGNTSALPDEKTTPMATIHFDFHPPVVNMNFKTTEARVEGGGKISFEWSAGDSSLSSVWIKYYFNGDESKVQLQALESGGGTASLDVPAQGVTSVTVSLLAKDCAGFEKETNAFTFTVVPSKNPVPPEEVTAPDPVVPKTPTTDNNPEQKDTPDTPNPKLPDPVEKTAAATVEPNPLRVVVKYDVVQSGVSGLDRVELWVTRVGEKDWKKNWILQEFSQQPKGQFVFDAPEIGQYGFYVVAGNKAGVWCKPRPDGKTEIEPDYTKWVDPYAPFLKVLAPHKGEILRGGSTVRIRWVSNDDNLLDNPIKIELMRDGLCVMVIANAVPNTGNYDFEFPYSKGAYSIRITATDTAGHFTMDETGTFLIDTGAPRVSIEITGEDGLPVQAPTPRQRPEQKTPVTKTTPPAATQKTTTPEQPVIQKPQETGPQPKPADATAQLEKGREYLEMGQIENAITELARASDYFPNNAAILNEYGIALFRKAMYTQALINFQRAAELAPGETRYRWNVFLAHYQLGNADAAAQNALALLRMDGNWEEGTGMIDAVMQLYQKNGQNDKIAEFFNQVLGIEGLGDIIRAHLQAKMQ
jgi:hypothetical protein